MSNEPHNIYKLIDLEGVVRYIGITKVSRGEDRFKEHLVSKPPHTFEIFDRRESEDEAKLAEADYKDGFQTHRHQGGWNGLEGIEGGPESMSQMGSLGGKVTGGATMAKMPKKILRENGRNFNPELRRANGRKSIARMPKETLRANGRNNFKTRVKMRKQAIERYAKSGVLMKPYFFEPLFEGDKTDWAAYIKEQL